MRLTVTPEEVGELLRCSPFEERNDHDQTVTIGQEADGVAQITVRFAQLELGGRFDRVLIGEQVDQREILLALVWRRVFEIEHDTAEPPVLQLVEFISAHIESLGHFVSVGHPTQLGSQVLLGLLKLGSERS